MENLRVAIENDLNDSIESEWGIECELTSPDGQIQIYSLNDPTKKLKGQYLNFSRRENPDSGEIMIVNDPVLTLRKSSLIRVPAPGEKWYIKINDIVSGTIKKYIGNADRSPEHGSDIGFVRIYLQRITNSGASAS